MLLNWLRKCSMGRNFNILLKFTKTHQNITFYSNIMQYRHLLLRIYEFTTIIFYIFMLLINSDLSSNEWLQEIIDLMGFLIIFDDIALKFSHHSFYELNETVT